MAVLLFGKPPKEIEAVQVFSKMLVDDYVYPKDLI